jgi:hypothetical protein
VRVGARFAGNGERHWRAWYGSRHVAEMPQLSLIPRRNSCSLRCIWRPRSRPPRSRSSKPFTRRRRNRRRPKWWCCAPAAVPCAVERAAIAHAVAVQRRATLRRIVERFTPAAFAVRRKRARAVRRVVPHPATRRRGASRVIKPIPAHFRPPGKPPLHLRTSLQPAGKVLLPRRPRLRR